MKEKMWPAEVKYITIYTRHVGTFYSFPYLQIEIH